MRQLTHATCALLFSAMACTAPSAKTSEPGGDGDTPDIETHEDGPLSVRCESSEVADASLRRLTADEFQRSIEGIFPEIAETWGGVAMGVDAVGPSGFTTDARSLLVGPQSADEISRTAQDVATLVSAPSNIETILPCAGAADDSCAATFVDTYASKIYRKPLSDLDRSELLDYFDSVQRRSDFPTALKWTLVAMLQSPFFVYRSELGDETGKLSAHEVATALSYTFGGTPPDDALIAQAQSGDLEKQDIRVDVARRLMQTPGGRAVIKDFLKQWTGYEQVRGSTKDDIENFAEVREQMVGETEAFLDEVLFAEGGSVPELLRASFTYSNAVLKGHYGFGSDGSSLEKVQRPEGQGVGLLAQGSLLASRAHPNLSSPVFRGLFVFEKLLCGSPPPVPDTVPAIEESAPANTTRERFENAHSEGACQSCHQAFEPFGFALESYDPAGRFRNDENGFEINTSAETATPDGTELSFDGLEEMAGLLADQDIVVDCVSGQIAAYSFSGANGEPCLAEEQRTALGRGAYGLIEYFSQLAAAPSITSRKR